MPIVHPVFGRDTIVRREGIMVVMMIRILLWNGYHQMKGKSNTTLTP